MQNLDIEALKEKAKIEIENSKWRSASKLLSRILELQESSKEAYNLVICYIKMQDPLLSQSTLNKYGHLLSQEDIKELQQAIYMLPAKIKNGEIEGLAWYHSNITMNDVIGLDIVKKTITEKIILPIRNPNLYKEYGLKIGGGFIMYGPPGTGKTLLAKAIAGETGVRMLIADVKQLISKYQGDSSKNIGAIFKQAREGGPAIIFMDEVDSLAQSRNSSSVSSTGGEDRRIADALLTELDGAQADNSGVYVIGATNVPWELDDAITRSGRFNQFIYIPPPNLKDREKLWKYYTAKLKTDKINYKKLALMTFAFSPADIAQICKSSAEHALGVYLTKSKQPKPLSTKDFIWGIKNAPKAPLLKSFSEALESLRKESKEKQVQFKDMKKDIEFFYKKGGQRVNLYNFIAKMV